MPRPLAQLAATVAAILLLVLVWPSTITAGQTNLDALLSGVRCEAALRNQLRAWDARLTDAIADPPGPTGLRSTRLPTGILGLWTRLVELSRGELAVERISATRIERLRFDHACEPSEVAVAMPPRVADTFGDSDLIARIARQDRGVFLLWSPHMPLSVDQHAVLAVVARDLGLVVVPLLDPAADRDYADRVARERGLGSQSTRPLGGVELAFRGMTTHTPSLQVFASGELAGPVLFGYRNAAALRLALEGALGGK
jgi:hypothetical protein